jgi:hypothetical protein
LQPAQFCMGFQRSGAVRGIRDNLGLHRVAFLAVGCWQGSLPRNMPKHCTSASCTLHVFSFPCGEGRAQRPGSRQRPGEIATVAPAQFFSWISPYA